MNKTQAGEQNLYFEMESKKETEAGVYDEPSDRNKTPATQGMTLEKFTQGTEKKIQPSTEPDTVMFRRLLFIIVAIVAIAFLTAAGTLVIAVTTMISRNESTASKDSTAVYALVAEVEEMKKNFSYVQSLKNNTKELWLAIQKSSKRIDSLSALLPAVNASVNEKLSDVQQGIVQLDEKVINIGKIPGPRGPPGYNGTQGPPGPPGSPGSGKLSLCSYMKAATSGVASGVYASQSVQRTESAGKKFLGVNCDSNDAKHVLMSSTESSGKRTYKCTCDNTLSSGDANMYCYIHYWECPT